MKNIIWIVIGIAVLVGLFFLFSSSGPTIEPPLQLGVLHPQDHVKGASSSTVVLMEYSDFQCPACRSYYPILRQIMQEFGDRVTFVYRHFPLTGIHANAEFAARAAEAAGKQGKFWEMHDLLFEKQNEWATVANVEEMFSSYAKLLDLNIDQFKLDWRSKEVKDFVAAERLHALKSGLQGTPTLFINGKQIVNPNSFEDFRKLILDSLAQ